MSLQWRHNDRDDVPNHRRLDCLLNRLFRNRSKKTSNFRVTGLCEGNSPVTGEFPTKWASKAENVSIWWCHHGICFKHFDTRYLVFYNTSPPRMFLSLDLLWEYRIQHGTNGPLYVTSSYSTWIFCRGVSGFATDCPCGVWCRGLTTCLLHVCPPFGNRILNNSWAVGLT